MHLVRHDHLPLKALPCTVEFAIPTCRLAAVCWLQGLSKIVPTTLESTSLSVRTRPSSICSLDSGTQGERSTPCLSVLSKYLWMLRDVEATEQAC